MRVVIVRLGAMGDVIHALPAVAALRGAWPEAQIGWAIEARWAALLCARPELRFETRSAEKPLVDALHTLDPRTWRAAPFSDESWREMRSAISGMRASRYDLAIDLQGLIKSAVVAQLSGADARAGFARTRESAAGLFYTRRIATTAAHVVEQNLQLVGALTAKPVTQAEFALPRDAQAEHWCDVTLGREGWSSFAVLNPGAGWGAKLWQAQRYGEVARALRVHGIISLVNHGPGEEALADAVVQASGGAAAAVRCSISELMALTRRARIFVGGDTGPMHLAAALKVPVVALFGPTDPIRNGPYGTRAIVLRSPESETSYSHATTRDVGLESITAEEVIAAARHLLAGGGNAG
jgi:heptosyltransferase-1